MWKDSGYYERLSLHFETENVPFKGAFMTRQIDGENTKRISKMMIRALELSSRRDANLLIMRREIRI